MVAAASMRRKILAFGIATIAALTMLGHMCIVAGPADADSAPNADSHHGGPNSVPDGTHATLCDGMMLAKTGAGTTWTASHGAALPSFESGVVSLLALPERSRESFAGRADVSPPLFLLHASFRI